MGILRNIFLWSSRSERLRHLLTRYNFVRKSVTRFMPGEEVVDALDAALKLRQNGIPVVLTHLGENVSEEAETRKVRDHYLNLLDQIRERGIDAHISVKLTELGLDLDLELCHENFQSLVEKAERLENFIWIDMEGSKYTDVTIELYQRVRSKYPDAGLCLQAYLYRTAADLEKILPLSPVIRLVKGAYAEPSTIAYPKKHDTDENYFALARKMLQEGKAGAMQVAIATHDQTLIRRIQREADSMGISRSAYEVQMLFGIRVEDQLRLVREGVRVRVLISYGSYWFPWYMRRLAERPANVLFVLRNLLLR